MTTETTTLEPHQLRMKDELYELSTRLKKLKAFIAGDIFPNLHEREQRLLDMQAHIMTALHDVISQRSERFEDEVAAPDMGDVSDGYHTFNELYAHRVRLFSALMRAHPDKSWWSRIHQDGSSYEGWIIAGISTPEGQVTYHLPESEIPFLPENTMLGFGLRWDGHTADDVLERLKSL